TAIGKLDPNNPNQAIQTINHANTPKLTDQSHPSGIASANGSVWFTQPVTQQIGKYDPAAADPLNEFTAPVGIRTLASRIIGGPDGNLWFTEFGPIGIFSPTGTLIKEVALPGGPKEEPFGITVGPDGNIWYSAGVQNASGTGFVSFSVGTINTSLQS